MEVLTKSHLEEVFIDVRKAFRLLYSYQRRVMDTIQFIGDSLSRNVVAGYTLFSSMAPRNGSKLNLDSWAWDWLPMMCYEFYFGEETIGSDVYKFAIAVYSDTGFDDAEGDFDHTEVDRFVPAEQSTTKLFFYLGRNMWKTAEFEEVWNRFSGDEFQTGEGAQKFVSKRFDLSDFLNEEHINARIKEFKEYCKSHEMGNYFGDSGRP